MPVEPRPDLAVDQAAAVTRSRSAPRSAVRLGTSTPGLPHRNPGAGSVTPRRPVAATRDGEAEQNGNPPDTLDSHTAPEDTSTRRIGQAQPAVSRPLRTVQRRGRSRQAPRAVRQHASGPLPPTRSSSLAERVALGPQSVPSRRHLRLLPGGAGGWASGHFHQLLKNRGRQRCPAPDTSRRVRPAESTRRQSTSRSQ